MDVFVPGGAVAGGSDEDQQRAQVFEGIESIEKDGTVVLTDKSAGIFKKLLDFDCKVYTVKDSDAKAKELDEKFKRWADRV